MCVPTEKLAARTEGLRNLCTTLLDEKEILRQERDALIYSIQIARNTSQDLKVCFEALEDAYDLACRIETGGIPR